MTTITRATVLLVTCIAFIAIVPTANASSVLNGGFELGFTSWTRADQLGSDGTFFLQTGLLSPINGDPVPLPPEGLNAAMTDAMGPGSHVLYQDFVVPTGSALLSFSLFIGNRADRFATPATLDFSTPALNQQARVDILKSGTDPFSVVPADVLLNLYQTNVGNPLVSGYNAFNFDVTPLFSTHVGETVRLRFAETDNLFTFQFGVDNVRLETVSSVPEPQSIVLLATGLLVLLPVRRRI